MDNVLSAPVLPPDYLLRIRWVILLLSGALLSACNTSDAPLPEPAYQPHILQPNDYRPAAGQAVTIGQMNVHPPIIPKAGATSPPVFIPTEQTAKPVGVPDVPAFRKQTMPPPASHHAYLPIEAKQLSLSRFIHTPAQLHQQQGTRFPIGQLNLRNGLNSQTVTSIMEDPLGRIWINGNRGSHFNIWDGGGFSSVEQSKYFINRAVRNTFVDRRGNIWILYRSRNGGIGCWDGDQLMYYDKEGGFEALFSTDIIQDRKGDIWIASHAGVYRWDGRSFMLYTTEDGLSHNTTRQLLEDSKGNIWIGTDRGISVWNGRAFTQYIWEDFNPMVIYKLLETQDGRIWIATWNGLLCWDGRRFTRYSRSEGLISDNIHDLLEDRHGKLWLSTRHGINIWEDDHLQSLTVSDGLSSDRTTYLLEASDGKIWVGTQDGGVNILDINGFTDHTPAADHRPDFRDMLVDQQGNIWIGTSGDGLYVWTGTGYDHYTTASGLSSLYIRNLYEASDGRIYIGTDNGMNIWDGRRFTHVPVGREGTHGGGIYDMTEDTAGQIWMGTVQGLSIWDGKQVTDYKEIEEFHFGSVLALLTDSRGNIWTGHPNNGLFLYRDRSFTHFGETDNFDYGAISQLVEDPAGNIWIATIDHGLFVWDGQRFTHFSAGEGLSSDLVYDIVLDTAGHLWAATYKGLDCLDISKGLDAIEIRKFDILDGLPDIPIYSLALARDGRLWVGAQHHIASVDPATLFNDSRPQIRLREAVVNQQVVDWRRYQNYGMDSLLAMETSQDVTPLPELTFDSVYSFTNLPARPVFSHRADVLTLNWYGLQPGNPRSLQYSYHLSGWDSWSPLTREQQLTFRDLPAGEYTFRLKAVGNNGRWSDTATYNFTILPPWWWSWWSKSLYVLAFFGFLYAIRHYELRRRLDHERAAHLLQLDAFKSHFFTNITHEFRTPLTVVTGEAGQIVQKQSQLSRGEITAKSERIRRNAQELMELVDQMLDLARIEAGKMELHPAEGDVIVLVAHCLEAFQPIADEKEIELQFSYSDEQILASFDRDKLRQIITNLVSNALKYTARGGWISVTVSYSEGSTSLPLHLSVEDTGEGIAPKDMPFVFNRFYRAAANNSGGTGIGLALTKELVELMGGTIELRSELHKGTAVHVKLPIKAGTSTGAIAIGKLLSTNGGKNKAGDGKTKSTQEAASGKTSTGAARILLIEDNQDLHHYLASVLEPAYQLQFAENGKIGIELAQQTEPDLIICDVMMPEKDGFEVCRILKADPATNHIPIILLTARADMDSRITGIDHGADLYLAKPFVEKELLHWIANRLRLHRELQRKYNSREWLSRPAGHAGLPVSENEQLMQQFVTYVHQHMESADLTINKICEDLHVTESTLSRKVKAYTGKSVGRYLMTIRMATAQQLLKTTDLTVSAVAHRVGYRDPNTFSRYFKKETGYSPSRYRKMGRVSG